MTLGSFLELYGEGGAALAAHGGAGSFDAVVTCFFIDCLETGASETLRILEAVRGCLRAGGCWINFGPMGMATFNWKEIRTMAEALGFRFLADRVEPMQPYVLSQPLTTQLMTSGYAFASVFSSALLDA